MILAKGRRFVSCTKFLFFLSLIVFILLPRVASADCADLSRYTNWFLESAHEVVFYMRNVPLASLNLADCDLLSSSTLRLIKTYVCDSDSIIVNGGECTIMTVKVLY